MKAGVVEWTNEEPYYNYAANTCTTAGNPYGTCGHYTQVVWADTSQVGCGLKYCPANTDPFAPPFDNLQWTFVVCDYTPPGNVNVGTTRPY